LKAKKLIIVSADWDPLHKKLVKVAQKISAEYNLEIEELKEDWIFLTKYGEKDELGGADIPQIFLELKNGKIIHIMTKMPISEQGKIDEEKAIKILKEKIESILREKT